MESLYFLVPVAIMFVAAAVKLLFWAIKSGQYEDLDTEAHRILFDDDISVATPLNQPHAEQTAPPEQPNDNNNRHPASPGVDHSD